MDEKLTFSTANLLDNDIGDGLRVVGVDQPGRGYLAFQGDALTYTRADTSVRQDAFAYTVADHQGVTARATVSLTIQQTDLTPIPVTAYDWSFEVDCSAAYERTSDSLLSRVVGGQRPIRLTAIGLAELGISRLVDGALSYTAPICEGGEPARPAVARRQVFTHPIGPSGTGFPIATDSFTDAVVGDILILHTIDQGTATIEPGWTVRSSSPRMVGYLRIADQAYIDRHKQDVYRDTQAYPYFTSVGDAPPGATFTLNDFIRSPDDYGDDEVVHDIFVEDAQGSYRFARPDLDTSYYRYTLIEAYGVGGRTDPNGPPPAVDQASTDTSDVYEDGNYVEIFASGFVGFGPYPETATIREASDIFAISFVINDTKTNQTCTTVVADTFSFTMTDSNNVSSTANVSVLIAQTLSQGGTVE